MDVVKKLSASRSSTSRRSVQRDFFFMLVCWSCHILLHRFSFVHARDHVYRHCVSRFKTSRHCQQFYCVSQMWLVSCIHASAHVGRFPNQRTRIHVPSCHLSTHDAPAGYKPAGHVKTWKAITCNYVNMFVVLVSAGLKPADVHIISSFRMTVMRMLQAKSPSRQV